MSKTKKGRKGTARNEGMNDVERLLTHQVHFNEGIIPMEDTASDMTIPLSQLPPEEARKAKRKFRKLWRKRKLAAGDTWVARYCGRKGEPPTRGQKQARKRLVANGLRREKIAPLLQKIMNPENKDKK